MATGKEIASKVPPPSKLVKGTGGDSYERDEESAADDDAAAMGAMEEFISAVKSGDAQAALDAYRNVKETC